MKVTVIRALGGVLNAAPALVRDVAGLAGVGFVAYGAWLAYPPAGFIVIGSALLTAVYLSARGN